MRLITVHLFCCALIFAKLVALHRVAAKLGQLPNLEGYPASLEDQVRNLRTLDCKEYENKDARNACKSLNKAFRSLAKTDNAIALDLLATVLTENAIPHGDSLLASTVPQPPTNVSCPCNEFGNWTAYVNQTTDNIFEVPHTVNFKRDKKFWEFVLYVDFLGGMKGDDRFARGRLQVDILHAEGPASCQVSSTYATQVTEQKAVNSCKETNMCVYELTKALPQTTHLWNTWMTWAPPCPWE